MATGSRSLTLKLIADIDDFNKNLNKGSNEVEGFGGKVEKFGKMAGAAFAAAAVAAAAYAGKLAIDGVKAAIEDEAAQVRLAGALKAATGATNEQIAAVEKQILKTSLATGVSDGELRPAMQRLAVSLGSTAKAQDTLNLALDISKATGKPLEAVTNALAKANEGNTTSLARLGVGLTAADLKTMSFTDAQQKLTDLWGGSASAYAQTFQGRIDRLKVTFDETKESIGAALLPIIEKLVEYILKYGVPVFDTLKGVWNNIRDAVMENETKFKSFVDVIKWLAPIIGTTLGAAFKVVGEIAGNVINIVADVVGAIKPMLNFAIDGINKVIRGLNLINPFKDIPYIPMVGTGGGTGSASTSGSFSTSFGGGTSGTGSAGGTGSGSAGGTGGGGGGGAGTSFAGATSAADLVSKLQNISEEMTKLTFQVNTGGISKAAATTQMNALTAQFDILQRQADALAGQAPTTGGMGAMVRDEITINMNGIINGEEAARVIVDNLTASAARGGVGTVFKFSTDR